MVTDQLSYNVLAAKPAIFLGSEKFRSKSLRYFLTLVVFLSIALPAAITGFLLIYKNLQTNIAEQSKATAERYAALLEGGMSVPLWNLSPELGQPLIDSLAVDPAVLSIKVSSDEAELFLRFAGQDPGVGENPILIVSPVFYAQRKVGEVELRYSLAPAIKTARNESYRLVIVIVLQLVISLSILSYFLHRRVIGPLQNLRQFAEGIASGDLRTTAPKLVADEFGALSTQLETMRAALESDFTNLEERVEKRTLDLNIINATLNGALEQLKQAQGSLIQSEKLAALGALVAGIAHELNTPIGNGLTVATTLIQTTQSFKALMISGMTRSGLQNFVEDVSLGSDLVCRNLQKASELVRGFKQVAVDRASAQRRRFNLNQFLQETYITMSPVFRRTAFKVVIDCAEDIEMNSYPGPLGQVIVNFLNNAVIHAFEGREQGTVTISVQPTKTLSPPALDILIVDDGVGIAVEHVAKIFDPFFTTKLGAGGSGLGMHIVHNIVTGMLGGSIEVISTLGVGTQFLLRLPLEAPTDDSAEAQMNSHQSQSSSAG